MHVHKQLYFSSLFLQDQQSVDEKIKSIIQPVIIITDDLYNSVIMYVVAEGMVLCNITTNKIAGTLVVLICSYYLYNMDYKVRRNIYTFLEMTLMDIASGKSPVSVNTLISILSNLS
jgi:hypothetical protein